MQPRPRSATLLLVALTAAGCADAPEPQPERSATADGDATEVEDRLDDVYDTFARAYERANVQMLMDSVYGDSAFYLPPGSPILHGQDQFRGQFSFLERFARIGTAGPDISFDIVDRDHAGDLAYDIGVYTLRTANAPADVEGSQGKFIVIWKRDEDGRWRIHADAFSPVN